MISDEQDLPQLTEQPIDEEAAAPLSEVTEIPAEIESPVVEAVEPAEPAQIIPPKRSRRPFIKRSDILVTLTLILILAVGAYFRFVGQNWDDYTHLHPDERFLTGVTTAIGQPSLNLTDPDETIRNAHLKECMDRYPTTNGVGDFFDSRCTNWYPKNVGDGLYVYGELPLFVVKIAGQLTTNIALAQATTDVERDVARSWSSYEGVHLVGRTVSATAELTSLIFLFLIGKRLYNRYVGLLAAALGAASVLGIQLSHFWTADGFTALPVAITVWFSVRAMDRGRWYDFVGAGIAMGAAIASRINVLPLFGVIGLAAIIYALPALDIAIARRERNRLIWRAVIGCVLAFLCMVVSFRFANPHAFTGGKGIFGIINLVPYRPFLDDLATSQNLTSGNADSPPNHQWASRVPYLFAGWNIIAYGMGLPLGLMALFGWAWAAFQMIRARRLWTRHALPVIWILVYFGYMGRLWVMSMRYYLPIYPFLILLASWAMYELVTRSRRWVQTYPAAVRRLAAAGAGVLLVGVVAFTYLWATMYTSIYRRELSRVEASQWVLRNIPAAFSTNIALPDGQTRLLNIPLSATVNMTTYDPNQVKVMPLPVQRAGKVDRIVISHVTDPDGSGHSKTFIVGIATDAAAAQLITQGKVTADFGAQGDGLGKSYTITLDPPVDFTENGHYFLASWADSRLVVSRQELNVSESADFVAVDSDNNTLGSVKLPNEKKPEDQQTVATIGSAPVDYTFTVPITGIVNRIDVAHLINPLHADQAGTLTVQLLEADDNNNTLLGQGTATVPANSKSISPFGSPFSVQLEGPVSINKDQRVRLVVSAQAGGPFQATGSVIATEGPWDDAIPYKICQLPIETPLTHDVPPGQFNAATCRGIDAWGSWYKGLELFMSLEDDTNKVQIMQKVLDQADYITISSNRFYDSLSRIPTRFPMSINYYNALFGGQIGFDVQKTFTSFPSLGSFEIADQYLPTYSAPKWLNEFEAEEAFTVYDHPTVFIFKKNASYDPTITAKVLNGVSVSDASLITPAGTDDPTLINVIRWGALPASSAPTAFLMKSDLRDIQTQGGTWSDLFNRNWAINLSPALAVIAWWLVIMLIGWITWPLLFVILPGLPDRGYPLAKITGMLIVSFVVWAGGALRFLTWSSIGILLTIIILAVISFLVARRNRAALLEYVRVNWRHLVIIEMITLILFVAFLFVRLGNPDLWAQALGGEKPMDFSYLNAVLRSTVFPPYDPWYAGGYLNYYYFGFVLVGMPVKLLGIMPEIGYNLIVPTLFALTGIGAFSVAFNIVASRWFFPRDEGQEGKTAPFKARRRFALKAPVGSPYIAGMLALVLCVVVGNLDTPRVFLTGVNRQVGCREEDVLPWKLDQFKQQNGGRQPTAEEQSQLTLAAEYLSLGDRIGFTISCFGQIFNGGAFPLSPDRWFWAPTRIISEIPHAPTEPSSNEIHEMPFFTFVFADLHAHMLAMPLTLLVIGWALSEVMIAGDRKRSRWVIIGATVLGGLSVGILRATNTWDWITYLLLGIVGMLFAFFLQREVLTRRRVVTWAAQLLGFFVVQTIAALPFTAFFATSYNAVKPYDGLKTPIWAYLDIHGLFLFIVFSLLVWQTARLLRRVYVRDFIGRPWPLILIVVVLVLGAAATLIFFIIPLKVGVFVLQVPIAIVCLPLIGWCGILFFIPDQSREMRILYALTALALAISYGVELVVLEGDIGRQNTFFKFYLQVWILLSVVGGVALAWLLHASRRWSLYIRAPWLFLTALLMSIAALFPIMATQGKIGMRMAPDAPHTLDGLAYMNYATYFEGASIPLKEDFAMIQWLQDNIKGTPVILEAREYGSEYKLNTRIAIGTGLPTIIGWNFHQQQQRTLDPLPNLVVQRGNNVQEMYNSPEIATVWKMLQFYHVEYIVVGKLEQTLYKPEGIAKFEAMVEQKLLESVYSKTYEEKVTDPGTNDLVTKHYTVHIYHLIPGATLPDIQAQQVPPVNNPDGAGQ